MRLKNLFQILPLVMALTGYTISSNSQQHSKLVEVTLHKTTSVVFPDVITSVDRGSRDLLAQKAKGVDNVLQLKAAREHFPETNLTVITADGKIREFVVRYAEKPLNMVQEIVSDSLARSTVKFPERVTESEIRRVAAKISGSRRNVHRMSEKSHGIYVSLLGVYIKDDVIFYHFKLDNHTNIRYDVEFIRFSVRDLRQAKRTASQEVDLTPLIIHGDDQSVKGNSSQVMVYALQKFTIPDAKHLVLEVFEKNGGRHLDLSIKNKTIVKAKLII